MRFVPGVRARKLYTPRVRRLRMPCLLLLASMTACESPFMSQSGMLTFPEKGAHGAAVLTPEGVEFRDRADVPQRVVSRDPMDPWKAPIGFILPKSGRFTKTSQPTTLASNGIVVVLRPSDTRVPSWGGEVLLRVDVHTPGAPGTARAGEAVAVVIDAGGSDVASLVEVALSRLGARDKMAVVDARGPRVVVPAMPATYRSLGLAATNLRLESKLGAPSDLASGIRLARAALGATGTRRIVVITPGRKMSKELRAELDQSQAAGVTVSTFGSDEKSSANELSQIAALGKGTWSADPSLEARAEAIRKLVPPAGAVMFQNVMMMIESTPAPSHVLEASGGDARWTFEGGELILGELRSGDARNEIMRVTVPAWVPGKAYKLRLALKAHDVALNIDRELNAELTAIYDNDIERIAESRHGDVIAYASALATLHRMHAAFVGDSIVRMGGLRKLARMHVDSLALLARDLPDRGFAEDAIVLNALLDASE